jgi:hypothetical protein
MALVLALTVAVRIGYFVVLAPTTPDWSPEALPRNGWLTIATNLANGQGYTTGSLLTYYPAGRLVPTAARSPVPVLLFAGIIRLVGSAWYYPLLALAWCCSGVVAVCGFWIARRASGREWLGVWTGVVFACYLSEMYITTTFAVGSEPIFSMLLAGYLVLTILAVDRGSVRLAGASGAALALASLSRPAVLLLPIVPIAWMLYQLRGRAVGMVLALLLTFVTIHIPWVARNYAVFGRPIATTTLGGFVLYRHNGMIEDDQYHVGYSLPEFAPRVYRVAAAAGRPLASFDEGELDTLLSAEGMRIISTYPWRYLKLCAYRSIWIWYVENSGRGLYALQNGLIYLLALVGLVSAIRTREPVYVLLILQIAYFVAVHSAINVQYRFICPLMPVMILLAGLPVHAAIVSRRERMLMPSASWPD